MTGVYPVSIKGVLSTPKGEVVLLLNEREEWELPGGRIETGETAAECLAREIQEELSIQVAVGKSIDTYLFEVIPGKHVFIATYRCALAGEFNPVISHEHKRIGLFQHTALPANLAAGYRASIAAACFEPWHTDHPGCGEAAAAPGNSMSDLQDPRSWT